MERTYNSITFFKNKLNNVPLLIKLRGRDFLRLYKYPEAFLAEWKQILFIRILRRNRAFNRMRNILPHGKLSVGFHEVHQLKETFSSHASVSFHPTANVCLRKLLPHFLLETIESHNDVIKQIFEKCSLYWYLYIDTQIMKFIQG